MHVHFLRSFYICCWNGAAIGEAGTHRCFRERQPACTAPCLCYEQERIVVEQIAAKGPKSGLFSPESDY
jgi:hypothetical protein